MKDARFDLRIESSLKRRVEAEAKLRGQTLTVFTERALESALRAPHIGVPTAEDVKRAEHVVRSGELGVQPAPTLAPDYSAAQMRAAAFRKASARKLNERKP